MPKVTGPLFSMTAKGTLGKAITFQGGPSGIRVQRVPKHRDRYSDGQSIQRASFVSVVSQWNALPEASKQAYEDEAKLYAMTGYNLFIKRTLIHLVYVPPQYTIDRQVGASNCDCAVFWNVDHWAFFLAGVNFAVGYYDSTITKAGNGARFTNIAIPQGATVKSAYIKITCNIYFSGTIVKSKIIGDDEDNCAVFSTLADYQARRGTSVGGPNNNKRTTAEVLWDSIPVWSVNVEYQSPDISAVIQEILNRPGWVSGNALALFWDDHDARGTQSNGVERSGYSYDGNSSKCVKLHIEAEK